MSRQVAWGGGVGYGVLRKALLNRPADHNPDEAAIEIHSDASEQIEENTSQPIRAQKDLLWAALALQRRRRRERNLVATLTTAYNISLF